MTASNRTCSFPFLTPRFVFVLPLPILSHQRHINPSIPRFTQPPRHFYPPTVLPADSARSGVSRSDITGKRFVLRRAEREEKNSVCCFYDAPATETPLLNTAPHHDPSLALQGNELHAILTSAFVPVDSFRPCLPTLHFFISCRTLCRHPRCSSSLRACLLLREVACRLREPLMQGHHCSQFCLSKG